MIKPAAWRSYLASIDWQLLVFLLLFLDVKMLVKLGAVMVCFILLRLNKQSLSFRLKELPMFYPLVIIISILVAISTALFVNVKYDIVLATGILFWLLCLFACAFVKHSVETKQTETIHRTILLFICLNALVSISTFISIIIETGSLNPYLYQGNHQKYFIGTGDYIRGITFDTSTTNAIINALGLIYFLGKNKYGMVIICMAVMLMAGSNMANGLLLLIFIWMLLFGTNRNQKSIIVVCLLMLTIFLLKVSPQNNRYIAETWQRIFRPGKPLPSLWIVKKDTPIILKPDSILSGEERKQKQALLYLDSLAALKEIKTVSKTIASIPVNTGGKPVVPGDSIHTPLFQHLEDTGRINKKLAGYIRENQSPLSIAIQTQPQPRLPGKLIGLKQVVDFYKDHPFKILFGAGAGNFSSKLAFRATALGIMGGYPEKLAWISPDFKSHHLDLYLAYYAKYDGLHSVTNSPNSVYAQLLSEYGLAGLLIFIVGYINFFVKKIRWLSYGKYMLLFMLGAFFMEYWFEQLSVVVLLELFLFLDIKENQKAAADNAN